MGVGIQGVPNTERRGWMNEGRKGGRTDGSVLYYLKPMKASTRLPKILTNCDAAIAAVVWTVVNYLLASIQGMETEMKTQKKKTPHVYAN
jgi:hypothetical protein